MIDDKNTELLVVIEGAVERLRNAAWVCAWVLVLSSWVLSYAISSFLSGSAGREIFLISLVGFLLSSFAFFDVLIRLAQCQVSSGIGKGLRAKLINEQSFRAVPTHLIDNGDQKVADSIKCWLQDVANDVPEVRCLAKQYRNKVGVLRVADAVNLKIFADLTKRRLRAGFLQA